MKLRLDRDQLAEAITWTARALSTRPATPVLTGILLEADADTLTFTAYDYDVSRRSQCPATTTDPGPSPTVPSSRNSSRRPDTPRLPSPAQANTKGCDAL